MREFAASETMMIRQKVTVPLIFDAVKFNEAKRSSSAKIRWIRWPLSSCLALLRIYGIVHMQVKQL